MGISYIELNDKKKSVNDSKEWILILNVVSCDSLINFFTI